MKKTIIALGALILSSSVLAETKFKMASGYPEATHQTKTIRYFVEQINDKTGGEVGIEVFPNQSLVKRKNILPATKVGKIDFGEVFMSFYGERYPLWEIDNLPFLADTFDKSEKLWALSRERVSKQLEEMNLVLLYAVPWPGQNFYSNEVISDSQYFDGKIVRSYNATTAEMATLLGAEAKNVAFEDVRKAFLSGDIDAMITSSATGISSESWGYSKYYTKVNAFFPKNMVIMNKVAWDGLESSTQNIIKEAAKDAEKFGWDMAKSEQASNELTLAEEGMTVAEPSNKVRQLLFKIGQQMDINWRKKADKESLSVMKEFRGY